MGRRVAVGTLCARGAPFVQCARRRSWTVSNFENVLGPGREVLPGVVRLSALLGRGVVVPMRHDAASESSSPAVALPRTRQPAPRRAARNVRNAAAHRRGASMGRHRLR